MPGLNGALATSLEDLLLPDAVFPRARWQGKRQVLSGLSHAMASSLGLDPQPVLEGVLERERLGSTGVGEGVAIPHARIRNLTRAAGGFARLEEAADFDAIDGRPTDLVFMILAPEDAGSEHLRALARVSRLFRQDAFRTHLRNAHTVEAVLDLLAPGAATNAA